MKLRKLFQLFIVLNVLISTSFSAFGSSLVRHGKNGRGDANYADLVLGTYLDKWVSPSKIAAPIVHYSVCAALTCNYHLIQVAIGAVSPGATLDLYPETYTETITIDKDITILGAGANKTIIQAAGTAGIASDSVITVDPGNVVSIQGVTIRYGGGSVGGGIFNQGTLTLLESMVVNNTVTGVAL